MGFSRLSSLLLKIVFVAVAITVVLGGAALYPYGLAAGDRASASADDACDVSYRHLIKLFGTQHSTIYVCTNGLLSLGDQVTTYTPTAFPTVEDGAMIAAYWADIDGRKGAGKIWSRETHDSALLRNASSRVESAYDTTFQANWGLVATWSQVEAYDYGGSGSSGVENNFQVLLLSNADDTYVLYLYADILWTHGSASSGMEAQVGFDAGDGAQFFAVENSGTPSIANVDESSNFADNGAWLFRLRDTTVEAPPEIKTCGNNVNGTFGIIKSPNYPEAYDADTNCYTKIDVPSEYVIQLNFTDFLTESGYDIVEISDEHGTSLDIWSGSGPIFRTLPVSSAILHFRTDSSESEKGWYLVWSAIEAPPGLNQTIHSPGFPYTKYPRSFDSNQKIQVAPGSVVKINFVERFDMEVEENCNYDYLKIHDDASGELLLMRCGRLGEPTEVTSTSNAVNVVFHTDGSVQRSGWSFNWVAVVGEDENNQTISSPGYPTSNYPNYFDQTWPIEVAPGSLINIQFVGIFELESETSCAYDYVKILDGITGEELLKRCGNLNEATHVTSTSNVVNVVFHTDSSVTQSGWSLVWNAVGGRTSG